MQVQTVINIINTSAKEMEFLDCSTCMTGKLIPTRKLASQLAVLATLTAAGRGPCENSSAVMNQGMGPKEQMETS